MSVEVQPPFELKRLIPPSQYNKYKILITVNFCASNMYCIAHVCDIIYLVFIRFFLKLTGFFKYYECAFTYIYWSYEMQVNIEFLFFIYFICAHWRTYLWQWSIFVKYLAEFISTQFIAVFNVVYVYEFLQSHRSVQLIVNRNRQFCLPTISKTIIKQPLTGIPFCSSEAFCFLVLFLFIYFLCFKSQ